MEAPIPASSPTVVSNGLVTEHTLVVSISGGIVRVDPNPALVGSGDRVTWILPRSHPGLRISFLFVRDLTLGSAAVSTGPDGPFNSLVHSAGRISGTIRNAILDPPVHLHRFFYGMFLTAEDAATRSMERALEWENPIPDKIEALGINGGGIDVPARPPFT